MKSAKRYLPSINGDCRVKLSIDSMKSLLSSFYVAFSLEMILIDVYLKVIKSMRFSNSLILRGKKVSWVSTEFNHCYTKYVNICFN